MVKVFSYMASHKYVTNVFLVQLAYKTASCSQLLPGHTVQLVQQTCCVFFRFVSKMRGREIREQSGVAFSSCYQMLLCLQQRRVMQATSMIILLLG